MPIKEIEPLEVRRLLDAKSDIVLLDVRQPDEHELVRIEGSTLIPLMELQTRLAEVKELIAHNPQHFVVYCRSGGRSGKAVEFLHSNGIPTALNLRGGINAYAKEADNTLTPY